MTRVLLLGAATLALGACSLAPKYVQPAPPVPASWPVGDAYLAQSEAALPRVTLAALFRDPRLQALIDQALANNRDLRVAAANVAAARAQVRVTRSAQFPAIGISGSGDYTDGGIAGGVASGGRESYALQAGVSAFELDLFGRLANATAADRDRAFSTEAVARTVRLALVADLAEAWTN
ncbi:MAG: TolC family protein, partial [Sphingopyxis sp.]